MPIAFDDMLNALCSEVKLHQSNSFQSVFLVGDQTEARLVCDVLIAYGFDAKLYSNDNPQQDANLSKIYITQPAADDAQAERKIAAAVAYARSLKPIKQELDARFIGDPESNFQGYHITFGNIPGSNSKQIIIQVIPAGALVPASRLAAPPPAPTAQNTGDAGNNAAALPQKESRRSMLARKKQKEKAREEFLAGPALTQKTYPKKIKQKGGREDTLRRQLFLYITGNSANATGIFIAVIIIPLIVISSLVVMAKTFLCPDLAVEDAKRNKAWYCHYKGEDNDKKNDF